MNDWSCSQGLQLNLKKMKCKRKQRKARSKKELKQASLRKEAEAALKIDVKGKKAVRWTQLIELCLADVAFIKRSSMTVLSQ